MDIKSYRVCQVTLSVMEKHIAWNGGIWNCRCGRGWEYQWSDQSLNENLVPEQRLEAGNRVPWGGTGGRVFEVWEQHGAGTPSIPTWTRHWVKLLTRLWGCGDWAELLGSFQNISCSRYYNLVQTMFHRKERKTFHNFKEEHFLQGRSWSLRNLYTQSVGHAPSLLRVKSQCWRGNGAAGPGPSFLSDITSTASPMLLHKPGLSYSFQRLGKLPPQGFCTCCSLHQSHSYPSPDVGRAFSLKVQPLPECFLVKPYLPLPSPASLVSILLCFIVSF